MPCHSLPLHVEAKRCLCPSYPVRSVPKQNYAKTWLLSTERNYADANLDVSVPTLFKSVLHRALPLHNGAGLCKAFTYLFDAVALPLPSGPNSANASPVKARQRHATAQQFRALSTRAASELLHSSSHLCRHVACDHFALIVIFRPYERTLSGVPPLTEAVKLAIVEPFTDEFLLGLSLNLCFRAA